LRQSPASFLTSETIRLGVSVGPDGDDLICDEIWFTAWDH
jgi:hypothetical protein